MSNIVLAQQPSWQPGDPCGVGGRISLIWEGWDPEEFTWREDSPVGAALVAISQGATQTAAVAAARIPRGSWYEWVRKGRLHGWADGVLLDLEDVTPRMRPFAALLHRIQEAQAILEVELVSIWRTHAVADWRAAERLLAKRLPDRWGDKAAQVAAGDTAEPVGELTGRLLDELERELREAGLEV